MSCTAHLLSKPQILCFTMLLIGQTPQRVPLLVVASTLHVMHIPWAHPAQHPKLHLNRYSCFCTAHGGESLYFIVCIKTRLTCD